MSGITYFTPKYTLIDKTDQTVTPLDVEGDATTGNLTKHRSSCVINEVIGKSGVPNATLVLRAPEGLFHTSGQILTDEAAKSKYLIDLQIFQPSDIGEPSENNEGLEGRLFRMEITSAVYDKGVKGEHVTLQLTNYDIRVEELVDAERLELLTPKQAFIKRMLNSQEQRIDEGPIFIIIDFGAFAIDLPNDERLRQDWIPSKPTSLKNLLDEIIDKVSKPEIIGSLNRDFYWFTNASPTSTNLFTITAKQFGEIDTGITLKDTALLSPTDQLEFNKQVGIRNSNFKNLIIARAKPGSHTFPMDFIKHASDLAHARIASVWSVLAVDYRKGDYVKFGNEYFKALQSSTSNGGNSPLNVIFWENLSVSLAGSPWTLDIDAWIKNMSGHENPTPPFVGYFHDFNIVRANYDRNDEFDDFEKVSVKDIEDFIDDPATISTDELQNGRRWLVKNGVGLWNLQNNRIAQISITIDPDTLAEIFTWKFSIPPVNDDMVNDLKLAAVRGFVNGAWQIIASSTVSPASGTPFHPVTSISIVKNRRNLDKAIRFSFNWNAFDLIEIAQTLTNINLLNIAVGPTLQMLGASLEFFFGTTGQELLDFLTDELGIPTDAQSLADVFGTGLIQNRAGRWCGWHITAPFSRKATASNPVGHFIKNSTIDLENLHSTIDENAIGWNNDIKTENLGGIHGLEHWVRNSFYDAADVPISGMANIPYIYWWRDIADRIVYSVVEIPSHNLWQKIKTPAGPKSNLKLHDSRIDELFKIFGFTFPDNFFIAERELTGVKFDWRRVREFGCFYRGSYDKNFFYKAGQNFYLDSLSEHINEEIQNLAIVTGGAIDVEKLVVDHVDYDLDDIHFIKDAYVLSSDIPVTDLRQKVIDLPNQFDYINIKSILEKVISRHKFHPGNHTFDCRGDVRLQAGKFFTVNDSSTPTPIQITPVKVSHIDDSNGYNCQLVAVFKYEVPVI